MSRPPRGVVTAVAALLALAAMLALYALLQSQTTRPAGPCKGPSTPANVRACFDLTNPDTTTGALAAPVVSSTYQPRV